MSSRSIYGLRKLALFDSANYDSAIIPLDEPIGLVANNNRGKTGLINALQFLFIPNKSKQNFIKYTREESQRFYFPNPWSYVLIEVLTPGGAVVIGCVGRGASHAYDYSYFAYNGVLTLSDYRTSSGAYVRGTDLREHMEAFGRQVFAYRRDEYRDHLFNRGKEPEPGEPDFGIFKLAPRITPDLFQTIFSRVLRLDELDADLVKGDLVEIYSNDLPQALDFNKAWEREYEGINCKRERLRATETHSSKIQRLRELRAKRIELRTIAVHQMRAIDRALEHWESYQFEQQQVLQGKSVSLAAEKREFDRTREAKLTNVGTLSAHIEQTQAEEDKRKTLAQMFNVGGIVATEEELEFKVGQLAGRNHDLRSHIRDAGASPIGTLETALRRFQIDIQTYTAQLTAGSLTDALHETLPPAAADALTRAFSLEALALGAGQYTLEPAPELTAITPAALNLPGLQLDVSALPPRDHLTSAQLQEQIAYLERQRDETIEKLNVARNLEAKKVELAAGERQESEARDRLIRFRDWVSLEVTAESRAEWLATLKAQLEETQATVASSAAQAAVLQEELEQVQRDLNELANQSKGIARLVSNRLERQGRLRGMEDKGLDSFIIAGWSNSIPMATLHRVMEEQDQRCRTLDHHEGETANLFEQMNAVGLGGLGAEGGLEAEVDALINYWSNLDKERVLITHEEVNATTAMQNMLEELRKGLVVLEAKVNGFNKIISRHRISDLEVFKINVVHDDRLVGALDTIINSARSGRDQASLFSSPTSHGEIQRAVKVLRDQVTLDFKSLFSLQFEVGKRGHPIQRHHSLKTAGSDGTTATAKLVIGLAMLSLLRDSRRGAELRAACYLDEAAALDSDNQTALIDIASTLGFTLVMAAPSQLITPRWCIPIRTEDGRNLILESDWIGIEPLEEMEEQQPALTEATPA